MEDPDRRHFSGYRAMWLMVLFDLPVDSKQARKQYGQFRKTLLRDGFIMLQYSVYARYCMSEEASLTYRQAVRDALPPEGHVRLISVTERQYSKMEVFWGKKREPSEDPPSQLMLF